MNLLRDFGRGNWIMLPLQGSPSHREHHNLYTKYRDGDAGKWSALLDDFRTPGSRSGNPRQPRRNPRGVTYHAHSDAEGSAVLETRRSSRTEPQRQQGRPEERPAGWVSGNGYCFIFSMKVSGLTNRTACPGCGVAVTLPHVFPEAYPWSRTFFVLKFLRSSQERFLLPRTTRREHRFGRTRRISQRDVSRRCRDG